MPQIDTDNLISTSSQLSIGFPERSNSQLSKVTFSPYAGPIASDKNTPTTDECCIAMYSLCHDKLLLTRLKNKGFYLPNFPIRHSDSWFEVASKAVQCLLQELKMSSSCIFTTERLIDILRVQLPKKYPHYLTRVTFCITIDHNLSKSSGSEQNCISQPDDLFKWLTFDEIRQNDSLWGIEPIELFTMLRQYCHKLKENNNSATEYFLPINLYEYNVQDAVKHLTSMDSKYQKEKELLLSAKFTMEEVQKLYNEFIIQCFPSLNMTYASFKVFMNKIGWVNEEEILYKMVFRSYTSSVDAPKQIQFLTFDELIVGLAAMEERADHRANCLQLRLRYIFHFYDSDEDGKLNLNELTQMVADIKKKPSVSEINSNEVVRRDMSLTAQSNRGLSIDSENVVTEILKRIGNTGTNSNESVSITLKELIDAAMSEKNCLWIAEMTETLFRSNISTIDVASIKFDYKLLVDQMSALKAQSAIDRYDEPCERCHLVHFQMCAHAVKIDEHGLLRGTIKFDVCPFYKDTPFVQELNMNEQQFTHIITELHRLSVIAISMFSSPTGNIDLLRPMKSKETTNYVHEILKLVKEVVRKEPLVVQCISPCFFIGELWSNLPNLHALLSSISRMSPFVNPANIVFLGNYIDPNSLLGVEAILYLFCFKILMPKRIILLRGQNEFRASMAKSKFYQECIDIFDFDIWNEIFDIFDLLPFVAVVDDRLYLAKSGIPLANKTIDKIESLNPTNKTPIPFIESYHLNNIIHGKLVKRLKTKVKPKRSHSRRKSKKTVSENKSKESKSKETRNKKDKSLSKTKTSIIKSLSRGRSIKETSKSLIKKSPQKSKSGNKDGEVASNKKCPKKSSQISASKPLSKNSIKSKTSITSVTNSINSNSSGSIVSQELGFTLAHLKQFLARNHFSHFIRSDVNQSKTFKVACRGKMITIGGIGQPSESGKVIKINGTIGLVNRYKIRVLKFEQYSSKIELINNTGSSK